MLQGFFRWNRRLSRWVEERLPEAFTVNLKTVYRLAVADRMNARSNQMILDMGSGKMCRFAEHREADRGMRIIGCDLSEEELLQNLAVDYRVVMDATRQMPFKDESMDIVTTRSTLEHLPTLESFFAEAQRVLKPGGYFIHIFPCRFSPFSILNQLLPHRLAQKLLYYFHPEWKEVCGFKAYYNNCYYNGALSLLKKYSFERDKIYIGYYQSIYYDFFLPFYILILCYDLFIYSLGIKNLAAQMLIVGRKASG
jgi:ubiquinone/menaquinone biosynthesis C-methylase UbiE